MILEPGNVLSWMKQGMLIASIGAFLPIAFRIRHSRTQLAYCHLLLAACLILPLVQPWRHPVVTIRSSANPADRDRSKPVASPLTQSSPAASSDHVLDSPAGETQHHEEAGIRGTPRPFGTSLFTSGLLLRILGAGVVARLGFLMVGLWHVRRRRIAAMPLYPIPEPVHAAFAITHANALLCISSDTGGPVMLGWLTPVVLLPESFLTLGDEAQCAIACHELLHVRRNDWIVTLLEELAGALLWFNPAIWLLLGQTRLAREQMVDEEVVRLTAAREPYIDALLTIARARPGLDLAPAPLFLRRRHLAQRMHSLLRDVSMSKLRLLSSYSSMTVILALAAWFAFASFPLVGEARVQLVKEAVLEAPVAAPVPAQPSPHVAARASSPLSAVPAPPPQVATAPQDQAAMPPVTLQRGPSVMLPRDANEPVTGAVHAAETPTERAAALSLLALAAENARMHIDTMRPYVLTASFRAGGNTAYTGSGELIETWLAGRKWRWTANLGSFSIVRIGTGQTAFDEKHAAFIPTRVQMLREAIFGAGRPPFVTRFLRTAAAQVNGKSVTCVLSSGMPDSGTTERLWEEEERCIDPTSGLLQMYSIAPGTYTVYSYDRNLAFHDRIVPDQITVSVAGTIVLEARISLTDATGIDESLLTPTVEMMADGPAVEVQAVRFAINIPSPLVSGAARPVIVRATIDPTGNVLDVELSSSSDSSLTQTALDLVKQRVFGPYRSIQRDAYINVRFVPQQ